MSAAATTAPGAAATEEAAGPKSVGSRFIQGDLASLRVVLGLVVIWVIFYTQDSTFLSATNITNLMLQITATGLISVGITYVLLLGEIDLSVGAVSGVTSAIMAVLSVKHGWDPYLAIGAAVVAGAVIGTVQGMLFSSFGIPSFVVTLAGLLIWQGAQLKVLGKTGTVNITDGKITGLAGTFYDDATGLGIAIVLVAVYAAVSLWGYRTRVKSGLADQAIVPVLIRVGLVAVVVIALILTLNSDRGLPLAVLILLGFVGGMQFLVGRTRFGRHVYAVGGNAEAARRAGISVTGIRVAVFGIAGTMAAIGGVLAASRLLAVNQSTGGSDLLLLSIAAPVVAGTSLFGGRGTVWSALLGALVIGSIANGMDLLALDSSVKFMVTGGVLLAAVIVDALARRQRLQAGRV